MFHDSLPVQAIADLLASTTDAKEIEVGFIALYNDPEKLFYLMHGIYSFPAMRKRRHLIERARDDYFAGRYYACIHVLLSVMDGFVNEFETVRRGLHAREAEELKAWDSVVGHHMGLTNAHKTFTKAKSTTNEEPIYELYRNGIVHGSQLNYDNIIVATKAWNRLFAVADWARAKEKEKAPVPTKPRWRDLFAQINDNNVKKAALDAWVQTEFNRGQDCFDQHPAYIAADNFLTLWAQRNYGGMAKAVAADVKKRHDKAMPARIREQYSAHALSSHQIMSIDHCAPAVCMLTVKLAFKEGDQVAHMRWLYEDDKGEPVAASLPGAWRLFLWEPTTFLRTYET